MQSKLYDGGNQLVNKSLEIFWRFLILGCVCFGGPAAHIGYFKQTFVDKLSWLDSDAYAKLIALSQFLPGPGSSQIGFAIGLHKAGLLGGFAAFLGFTLPSFIIMYCLAVMVDLNNQSHWLSGAIDGLKLLAVVVVFDAVFTMAKSFCNCRLSIGIAVVSASILLVHNSFVIQITVLLLAAMIGGRFKRKTLLDNQIVIQKAKVNWPPLIIFIIIFVISIVFSQNDSYAGIFASFYQNGSLVFGGGHVVLPLLETSVGASLGEQQFIFGYAAAQGIPGPMFTMATFMGANMLIEESFYGALLATIGIFLPGLLLVLGLHKCWQSLAEQPRFYGASWGINAAVVGFLAVAFYQPVFSSAVNSYLDLIVVLTGFIFLRITKISILILLSAFLLLGMILGAI